ncbi:MAG: DNA glycosylase [Candidatus Diapherotrites archaeon]|nr:DNA glycosylase [Candidatus Diapherotrites archaeon]
MQKIVVKDFSLQHTLECGQVFRWKKENEHYYGFIKNTPVKIVQKGNELEFSSFENTLTKKDIEHYFSLDEDLAVQLEKISKDEKILPAIKQFHGLRLIRQEPFECLISFICSIRTKIPQINQSLDLLAENFGEEKQFDGKKFHTFPSAEKLAKANFKILKKKCKIKTFAMAKGVQKAAQKISKEKIDLNALRKKSFEEAREFLQEFYCVGPKIADCVCLFALGKGMSYPVDTWIKKVMNQHYFDNKYSGANFTNKHYQEISEFAREYFGENAGLAQEYLYYYYRKK